MHWCHTSSFSRLVNYKTSQCNSSVMLIVTSKSAAFSTTEVHWWFGLWWRGLCQPNYYQVLAVARLHRTLIYKQDRTSLLESPPVHSRLRIKEFTCTIWRETCQYFNKKVGGISAYHIQGVNK